MRQGEPCVISTFLAVSCSAPPWGNAPVHLHLSKPFIMGMAGMGVSHVSHCLQSLNAASCWARPTCKVSSHPAPMHAAPTATAALAPPPPLAFLDAHADAG